ncbi:MAG TPA: site-specific integrase, partial [Planctomycetota bacterium]|nr:site-specific integrase [Planctomycetota bacterium]
KVRYLAHVDQFMEFAGIKHQHLVTLDLVLKWVTHLRANGWAWDTRRHALLYLRRACVMGTGSGIPNVIIGHKIDHQERRQRIVRAWALPQLAAALVAAEEDPRIRAAIALGGCLGLRPTEICRVDITDLELRDDPTYLHSVDVLHIGRRDAKNNASVRALPIPASMLPWLKAAAGKRKSGPLIESDVRRRGRHLTPSGLHQAIADALRAKPRPPIAPKDLRKTFATWAAPIISGADLERFLGHASALHAQVTVRHYLAHHLAEQLQPAAQALDVALSKALRDAAVKPRKRRAV